MNSCLVSVIIPAYNHQNYVQETIKSIINQTYQYIELIVIDDGSKDSTWAKIKELEKACRERFQNTYFETKENEGTCKTLNKLLSLTKGEYIYLIASDDVAKPCAIEKEFNFLSKNPQYVLCTGDSEYIDSCSKVCYLDKNGNVSYGKNAKYKTFSAYYQNIKKINFNSEDFGTYHTIYTNNYIPNGYLIRKSVFEKTGIFTPEAPLEDLYLMLQISKYSKMKYLDEVLFSYRVHPNNTMGNSGKMRVMSNKTHEYEQRILENLDFSTVNKDVYDTYKNGVLYKKQGVPYVFEIYTYKKRGKKVKKIKIFKKTIYEYEKDGK